MAPPKQTAFHLFNTLTSDQLSRLFSICGIGGASAATKATKSRILVQSLPKSQYLPTSHRPSGNDANGESTQRARLLSIDMGLKNLAYCVLDVDLPSQIPSMIKGNESKNPADAISSIANGESNLPNALEYVSLVGWKRVDVLAEAAKLNPLPNFTSDIKVESEPVENGGHLETDNKDTEKKVPSDTFEPLKLSRIAYNLIQREFLQYNPTHIVIERQRHRTGGHSSIQEWTVRVNTFEACLWAILTTLQQQSQHRQGLNGVSGNGNVDTGYMHLASVLPKQVAKFWLDDKPTISSSLSTSSPESTKSSSPRKSRHEKSDKIQLAYTWLTNMGNNNEHQPSLKISKEAKDQVTDLVDSFIYTVQKIKPSGVSKENEQDGNKKKKKLAKIDDLADCLLQALATVQWDLNRRAIFDGLIPDTDFDICLQDSKDLQDILPDVKTGHEEEDAEVTRGNKVKISRGLQTKSNSTRLKSKSKVSNQE